MDEATHLTKSTYLAGRQCLKRLWLTVHASDLATSDDRTLAALRDQGAEIGARARALFPGGVVVSETVWDHATALTRALLDDPSVRAIFEAAFEHDGVRIRVDVLERLPEGAWGLREVKASTHVKDVYLDDVAIQHYVLTGAGVAIRAVEIIHVDGTYVRDDGPVDWSRFFARRDVTVETVDRLGRMCDLVSLMRQILAAGDAPAIAPSPHCWAPYPCEFWAHCTCDKPEDWIMHLPQLRAPTADALRDAGVERIAEIPDDFPLGGLQARIREALRSPQPFVSPDVVTALAASGPPADYLDFETMSPAIPLYPGTRPYERLPFQWSLHRLDAVGVLTQQGFLADGRDDPRRACAESLLAVLRGITAPIVVYSRFEADVLGDLMHALPDLASELEGVRARLVDLYEIVRRGVYHRDFAFSFSLKRVAPALVPGFGYADLAGIVDGAQASMAFARIASGGCTADDERRIRSALLAYCARDTLALVEVHRALHRHARGRFHAPDATLPA